MRAVCKHLQRFNGIVLKRTVEDQESGKCEMALDFLALEVIDLWTFSRCEDGSQLTYLVSTQSTEFFPGKSQHSTSSPRVRLVCVIVPGRDSSSLQETLDGFRSTLDRDLVDSVSASQSEL